MKNSVFCYAAVFLCFTSGYAEPPDDRVPASELSKRFWFGLIL